MRNKKFSLKQAGNISSVTVQDGTLTLEEFIAVVRYGARLEFSSTFEETVKKIASCWNAL